MNLERVFNAEGIVILLALVLGVGAGLGAGAWRAEPAEAIVGGTDSQVLGGQVQFFTGPDPWQIGDPNDYQCAGTLISTGWVLIAEHCFSETGATIRNSGFMIGDTRLGGGDPYKIKDVKPHPEGFDAALVQLAEEAPTEHVVGYGVGVPEVGDPAKIRGWGATSPGGPRAEVLQEATMELLDEDSPEGEYGARLLFGDIGQGIAIQGDSGAGVDIDGFVYGLYTRNNDDDIITEADIVPTEDIADWIEQVSGVAPSGPALGEQRDPEEDEDSEDGGVPLDEDSGSGSGGCADSPTQVAAEDTSPEMTPDIEGHGAGRSGADVGNAIANAIEDVENADENVKALVSRLAQENPACNVMVIQQETYDGPEGISGVKSESTVVFGTNTFDVWVFDSGTFTNTGDMGYDNWGWSGVFTRSEDLRTVTFTPIG